MFCPNCGGQAPDGANVCPNCGKPLNGAPVAPQFNGAPMGAPMGAAPMANKPSAANSIGLVCGICSIVIAIIGGICWGVIGATIALVLAIVGIVFSTMAKKENGTGTGALVCSVIGIVFACIFELGCMVCGCSAEQSAKRYGGSAKGIGCTGICGAACTVDNETKKYSKELNDLFR